jgi:hypothetical protein
MAESNVSIRLYGTAAKQRLLPVVRVTFRVGRLFDSWGWSAAFCGDRLRAQFG